MSRFAVGRKPNKNASVFSQEFIIQNHADIVSCIVMLFVIAMTFKATSSIATTFVILQHNATDINDKNQQWLYYNGWKDIAAVFFYTLATIIVHAVIQEYVVDKLHRKVHLSKTKMVKFNESGQMVFFSLASVLYAGYIISQYGLFTSISSLWDKYPSAHMIMPLHLKLFFILQIAYWLHIYPEFYFSKSKKDEIRSRSVVALIYLLFITFAYAFNFNRVALCILLLHYTAEFIFHVCRLAYFAEKKYISTPGFKLWNVVFVTVRLGCASLAVLTFWYGLRSYETPSFDPATGNYNTRFLRINSLLSVCACQAWMMWNFIHFHLKRARERAAVQRSRYQLKANKKKSKKVDAEVNHLSEADQDIGRQQKLKKEAFCYCLVFELL
ncbi:Translocating chain-associated membrane protein 1-like 1 [Trichinella spiralis]|uniref:Translocating chain-associated membrane protein 1-like 1 n=1 Tax=Trichinella spiralis TaxID=6334 RepID=A0A0V1BII6_TRISP|nr:Translocating chain-associated membrane protein 1-like 1 [Trichinella spiralis]